MGVGVAISNYWVFLVGIVFTLGRCFSDLAIGLVIFMVGSTVQPKHNPTPNRISQEILPIKRRP